MQFMNSFTLNSDNFSDFTWNHTKICQFFTQNHEKLWKLFFTEFTINPNGETWNSCSRWIHENFDQDPSLMVKSRLHSIHVNVDLALTVRPVRLEPHQYFWFTIRGHFSKSPKYALKMNPWRETISRNFWKIVLFSSKASENSST